MREITIGNTKIGDGYPVFFIGEIGINHNGDLDLAIKLISAFKLVGVNAIKFQKRTPDICVPEDQKEIVRDTPWGKMTYLKYRHKIEFGLYEYKEIDKYCKKNDIMWFASCWDEESVDFIEQFNPPCYKIASASLTDNSLLLHHKKYNRPIIISTGMSTMDEINYSIGLLKPLDIAILHCTSTYPGKNTELNLNVIKTFRDTYKNIPIGYSGHEVGLIPTIASTVLGANIIERHITLGRSMWGSDQAASVEPQGVYRIIRDVREIEKAMGDGIKCVYESEELIKAKLRRR